MKTTKIKLYGWQKVMAAIGTRPNNRIYITEINDLTNITQSSVCVIIHELKKMGYIILKREGRCIYVSLTKDGKRISDACTILNE